MLRARSWIDRRMLASPGVDLRREVDSSVTHVSSLGFVNADGVPFQIQKRNTQFRRTNNDCFFFYFHLASGPGLVGGNHARKSDVPAIRPVDIPPVSVGRPAAEDGHATGVVLVGFNVVLIGYVSAFSLNIAVELPVVVFSAERADGGRGVGGV
jgi:hypothetical protein